MQYALNENGERTLATEKGQRARCPLDGCELRSKVGSIVTPHWAHVRGGDCDTWSEGEGPWHLGWKALVRPEACEVVMKDDRGHHRADIVGNRRTVVELQHSAISPEDITAREQFYGRMVWVFDARQYDLEGVELLGTPVRKTPFPERYRYYWRYCKRSLTFVTKPLFFDLGDRLLRVTSFKGSDIVGFDVSRETFIQRYLSDFLADSRLQAAATLETLRRVQTIHAYRADRKAARRAQREAAMRAEHQRQEAARRRAEELRLRAGRLQVLIGQLEGLSYNRTVQAIRKSEFYGSDQGSWLLDQARDRAWRRLKALDSVSLSTLILGAEGQVRAALGTVVWYRLKWEENRILTVTGPPYDRQLTPLLANGLKELRFRWDPATSRWYHPHAHEGIYNRALELVENLNGYLDPYPGIEPLQRLIWIQRNELRRSIGLVTDEEPVEETPLSDEEFGDLLVQL